MQSLNLIFWADRPIDRRWLKKFWRFIQKSFEVRFFFKTSNDYLEHLGPHCVWLFVSVKSSAFYLGSPGSFSCSGWALGFASRLGHFWSRSFCSSQSVRPKLLAVVAKGIRRFEVSGGELGRDSHELLVTSQHQAFVKWPKTHKFAYICSRVVQKVLDWPAASPTGGCDRCTGTARPKTSSHVSSCLPPRFRRYLSSKVQWRWIKFRKIMEVNSCFKNNPLNKNISFVRLCGGIWFSKTAWFLLVIGLSWSRMYQHSQEAS